MTSVMFVCLGNICRSPTAHGVFAHVVRERGLDNDIHIASSGTGSWHVGEAPDKRAQRFALSRGYDLSHIRAQQVQISDFERFDFILAMDCENLTNLRAISPASYTGHLGLFLDFAEMEEREVPDPYYGGDAGFEQVLDLVESASEGLLRHIQQRGD